MDQKKYKKAYSQRVRKANPYLIWAQYTIYHHNQKGHSCCFTPEELVKKITPNCEICGTVLIWTHKKTGHTSPTLDRMDNGKILTLDNVQILCRRCNVTKHDRTQDEFEDYCRMVVQRAATRDQTGRA